MNIPTLNDVAHYANVSTATVSRCLNTPDLVKAKTRARVMEVIQELGYAPNFGARVMAARRTNTIGVVIPTMENAIFAWGIQAFQDELKDHGFTLMIASSQYQPDVEDEQIRMLCARGADALLLIGHYHRDMIYTYLQKRNIPVLAAWAYNPNAKLLSVGFDNRRAMMRLAKVVIRQGHKKIGVISAPCKTNDRAYERVAGIRTAMKDHYLNQNDIVIIETSYSIESGAKAFRTLMQSENKPSVIMCGNDVLAVGALQMAKQLGFDVPRDISITGFDDIELASLVEPKLTTVHVPHYEMGRIAAQVLVEMLNGDYPQTSIELPTRLCLRDTLGPPQS